MFDSQIVGRYALYRKIASGGMATVHLGRLLGPAGFSRTVAIKRMHPQLTEDPEFVAMFLDEARLAARIRHPNVVSTLDIVTTAGQLFLVLDYVHGETLARLMRQATAQQQPIPVPIVAAILSGVLHGLHAAHEARDERGEPLGIVHRDVSPQNVIVGVDGIPQVLDFGVAKAAGRLHVTRDGQIKGKFGYMSPEQIRGLEVTRRSDIYAASVVLWEALAGRRLFRGDNSAAILQQVLTAQLDPPSAFAPGLPPALDAVVLRGLSRAPEERFATAREMASALEAAVNVAIAPVVGAWLERTAGKPIAERTAWVAEVESASSVMQDPAGAAGTAGVTPPPDPPAPSGSARISVEDIPEVTATLDSQMSSISVSTPASVPRPVHRRRWWLAGGITATVGLLLGVALLLHARTSGAPAAAAATPSVTSATPSVTSTTSTTPSASTAVTPSGTRARASPAAASDAGAATPARKTTARHRLKPTHRRVPRPPGPASRTNPQRPAVPRAPAPRYNPLDHL